MEIWKTCSELSDCYLVSNYGKIKSLTRKVVQKNGVVVTIKGVDNMKHHLTKDGYKRMTLIDRNNKKKNFLIHRLVAITFVELVEGKDFVNHKDGDRSNNYYKNLEWCTILENEHHKQLTLNKRKYIGVHKTKYGYAVSFKNKYVGHSVNLEQALEMYKKYKNESN